MATSTIPALKGALLTRLQARAGLHGVTVTWGITTAAPGPEWIWLGDVDGEQRAAAIAARHPREETYDLACVISVVRNGRDVRTAAERAFAIAAEIETELRTDPSVGGVVRTAEVDGPLRLEEMYDAGGTERCEGRVLLTIHCTARI